MIVSQVDGQGYVEYSDLMKALVRECYKDVDGDSAELS